jgi:hypothetical protein
MLTHEKKNKKAANAYNYREITPEQRDLLNEAIEINEMHGEEPHPLQARLIAMLVQQTHNEAPLLMCMHSLAKCALFVSRQARANHTGGPYSEWEGHADNLMELHGMLYELIGTGAVA